MAVQVSGSEIILSGTVGDLWFEDGFTASEVIAVLALVGEETDITIRLNSGGGIATEGSAIHAALARHKGKVTIVVEGIAASAASLIAMAGDVVEMALGSTMMIHDPSGFTFGTAADHELALRALTAMADSFAGVYAAKSGKTVAECRADMKTETWLTPDQAVAAGYADSAAGADNNNAADETSVAAFDYRIYANAPQQLVAMANTNGWRLDARRHAAMAAPTRQKETSMATPTGATTPEPLDDAALAAARTEAATAASNLAAEIVAICSENGVPAMAGTLIREGVTAEQARGRAASAKDIRTAVEMARKKDPSIEANAADAFIAAGKTVDQVRASLFERFVAEEDTTAINSVTPQPTAAAASATASMKRQLARSGHKGG